MALPVSCAETDDAIAKVQNMQNKDFIVLRFNIDISDS